MTLPYINEVDALNAAWQSAQPPEFIPLDDGIYLTRVTRCFFKKTKPVSDGKYPEMIIDLEFTVINDLYEGRKAWHSFYIEREIPLAYFKQAVQKLAPDLANHRSLAEVIDYFLIEFPQRLVTIEQVTKFDKTGKVDKEGNPRKYVNIYINEIHPIGFTAENIPADIPF